LFYYILICFLLDLGIRESDVEQFRRQRYQAAFGIESWCVTRLCASVVRTTDKLTRAHAHAHMQPRTHAHSRAGCRYDELKEHTFYTKSVALSYREAEALNKYHYSLSSTRVTEPLTDEVRLALGSSLRDGREPAAHARAAARAVLSSNSLTLTCVVAVAVITQDKALVKALEERLDEAIKGDERLANGAFIKLDTRSPKVASSLLLHSAFWRCLTRAGWRRVRVRWYVRIRMWCCTTLRPSR
jgi:hypothetical protein